MSAKGGPAPFSRILAGFQRYAWFARLRGRAVARSGSRALETIGPRRYLGFTTDIALAAIAFHLAIPVSAGLSGDAAPPSVTLADSLYALLAAIGVFGAMRLHRRLWSTLSDEDIRALVKASLAQTILLVAVLAMASEFDLLSVPFVVANWVLLTSLLIFPRALVKVFSNEAGRALNYDSGDAAGRLPVLLVGAGDNAENFIKAADRDPNCLYRPVGVVDEMGPYLRSNVSGVEILGRVTEIPTVVRRLVSRGIRPRLLIVTEEWLSAESMRMLLDEASRACLTLQRIGNTADLRQVRNQRVWLRSLRVEELLDRREHHPDAASIRSVVADTRVLVTGAAGPVGAELAKQICDYDPAQVTLVDDDEIGLFEVAQTLQSRFPACAPSMALCDVRDRSRVRNIFARHRPELVFHAVGMVHEQVAEEHPCEATLANVMASRYVADACIEFSATAMVLVSSAEAAEPTGVLGQSWKIAERYCGLLDRRGSRTAGAPRMMSLRVPDVLGAPGSIVARLERELANGGPLSLSSPDDAKNFISASAAATVALETLVLGLRETRGDGRAYAVEQAAPARIRDIANLMVRLSGLVPEKDIEFSFTGPTPGEMHHAVPSSQTETLRQTGVPGLVQIFDDPAVDLESLAPSVDELIDAAQGQATERVRTMLVSLTSPASDDAKPDHGGNVTQLKR